MFGAHSHKSIQKIGFLLLPEFSMIAFTAAVEPLRIANRVAGKPLYAWEIIGPDPGDVKASNGVSITPDITISQPLTGDVLFVCAGLNTHRYLRKDISGVLRTWVRKGGHIGSVCAGSLALAHAGLLNGYRCTTHWENIEGLAERYPDLDITATLFEIDRNRYTCAGGTTPLDMMIHAITLDHGKALGMSVADQMLHTFVRDPHEAQRMTIERRTGINHPKLLAAIGFMEAHTETPLTIPDLANRVNVSQRQLERLFKSFLGATPTRYYLEMRLQRAKILLSQTPMSILQIAISTGFASASHFTRVYGEFFNHPPTADRA